MACVALEDGGSSFGDERRTCHRWGDRQRSNWGSLRENQESVVGRELIANMDEVPVPCANCCHLDPGVRLQKAA